MDYIHFNPVKHGYTKTPAAWPHSTFHHAVINGLYPQSWSPTPQNLSTGEPNPD
jgi:putative transposase